MPAPNRANTAAATEAHRRRGDQTAADRLRNRGYLVLPAEVVADLPADVVDRINDVLTRHHIVPLKGPRPVTDRPTIPLPQHLDALTYKSFIPIGFDPTNFDPDTSTYATVAAPIGNWWVSGPRGSGKTMLLRNLLVGLARTVDTLAWTAEYTASLTAPWLDAMAYRGPIHTSLGGIVKGGIDWAVDSSKGTLEMLRVARRVIEIRRTAYQGQILRNAIVSGRATLPIGPDRPAIVVIVDEADVHLGDDTFHSTLTDLLKDGPQVGVHVVLATQDTRPPLPPELMATFDVVAAFDPNAQAAHPAGVYAPGDFVYADTRPPRLVRGYLQNDLAWTRKVVTETDARRPVLDQRSAAYAGVDYYQNRWSPNSDAGRMVAALLDVPTLP